MEERIRTKQRGTDDCIAFHTVSLRVALGFTRFPPAHRTLVVTDVQYVCTVTSSAPSRDHLGRGAFKLVQLLCGTVLTENVPAHEATELTQLEPRVGLRIDRENDIELLCAGHQHRWIASTGQYLPSVSLADSGTNMRISQKKMKHQVA